MRTLETICIMCPMGCPLTITETATEPQVSGNQCARGKKYGMQEFSEPKRVVTTLIRLTDGRVVSAKTNDLIKKELIAIALKECATVTISAPVKIGDIIITNIAGSGINLVATKNMERL